MNDQPSIALQARRRAVRGCIAEPAFGYILETFHFGWRHFPQRLMRSLENWNPYASLRSTPIVVCTDEPWPTGVLDSLRKNCMVTTLDSVWLGYVLRQAERILETKLPNARPHLMAFLARQNDLRHVALTDEVATAWALQFARDQLFKAELSHQHMLAQPDPWEQCVLPSGTTVRLIP